MAEWLIVLLVVAYLASPSVEARLWRMSRLSDRVVTALILARIPLLFAALSIVIGRAPDLLFVIGVAAVIALNYRWLHRSVSERGREVRASLPSPPPSTAT
jgi:hypothetical protein